MPVLPYSQSIHAALRAFSPSLNPSNDLFQQLAADPLACDFSLGNPHDMPLPGLVDALRAQLSPQNPKWFAYKESEPASRQAVAAYLQEWRGATYHPEDIFLTNGAFAGLAVTLRAILDPGDEVIFMSPPWPFYEPIILAYGGSPVRVSISPETLDLDIGAIEAAITPRTRAVIVNSPHNPTGKIYPPKTLEGLAMVLSRAQERAGRPVYLLSDEAYSRIIYDGRPFFSPTRYYPYSFLIYTYGKTLLAPGERIGFIALSPEMPDRDALHLAIEVTQFVTGHAWPDALLQYALPELNRLTVDIDQLQRRRDRLVDHLREAGYKVRSPEGTFYLLPESPWQDDLAYCRLLAKYHIYCLPGVTMELPGSFRISLTASDEMVERSLPGFSEAMKVAQSSVQKT